MEHVLVVVDVEPCVWVGGAGGAEGDGDEFFAEDVVEDGWKGTISARFQCWSICTVLQA